MRNQWNAVVAAALFGLMAFGSSAHAQGRDPYYILTTDYLGTGMALDVGQISNLNNGWWAAMGPTGTGDGQRWFFVPQNNGAWFRMTNQFNGINNCLDVHAEGTLYMDTCGNQIGQRWQLQNVNGAIFITNVLVPNHCLDVITTATHQVAMLTPCNNLQGQRWTFHDTGIYP